MKLAVALAAAIVVLAPSSAAGKTGARGALESWADSRHGWRVEYSTLLATDDGGASWHVVRRGDGWIIITLSRTSATAGVILVGPDPPRVTQALATRDGGRHWFQVADEVGEAEGHDAFLFFTRPKTLLRARPWPPRGSLYRSPLLHFTVVVRLTDPTSEFTAGGSRGALANIPGGIVALTESTAEDRRAGVVVFRNGRTIERVLPPIPGICRGDHVSADWPDIDVHGRCALRDAEVGWHSDDGGATWSALESPPRQSGVE